jgi:hypothetical protein
LPSVASIAFLKRDIIEVAIREVVEYAKRLVNETLIELSKLPECVEPDWLDKLEEERGSP